MVARQSSLFFPTIEPSKSGLAMSERRPLDILMTIRAPNDGGAERVWATLARGLAGRGDRVRLAVDHGSADGDGVVTEEIGEGHLTGVLNLARILRRTRPEIAMAATSASCVKLVVAAMLAHTGTPLVLSYHGFEEYRTGRLAAAAYWGLPLLGRIAVRIVAVSEGLRRSLIERWGAPADRTVRIYNPVEMDFAAAAAGARDLGGRPPRVLAVGRFSREKGLDTLIRAFARIDRPEARLTLIGGGPQEKELESLIDALGLRERVELLGWQRDPTPFYRRARLLVVPSRTEAFGMVVVEALAHGLPVVSTACGGPAEILEHGRYGRLVAIGDETAMAAAIEAALDDPGDPGERLARAADFSAQIGLAAWAGLVDEIVAAKREGRSTDRSLPAERQLPDQRAE
jgi:glycosyltransferase involved in cell wall biosynthesis